MIIHGKEIDRTPVICPKNGECIYTKIELSPQSLAEQMTHEEMLIFIKERLKIERADVELCSCKKPIEDYYWEGSIKTNNGMCAICGLRLVSSQKTKNLVSPDESQPDTCTCKTLPKKEEASVREICDKNWGIKPQPSVPSELDIKKIYLCNPSPQWNVSVVTRHEGLPELVDKINEIIKYLKGERRIENAIYHSLY